MSKEILLERAINMTINPTKAEKRFMELLEINNIKFKRQWVIGSYIVDYLIGENIIELDGSSHNGREVYDTVRDCYLTSMGYTVIRIQNRDVDNFDFSILKKKTKRRSKKQEFYNQLKDKSWMNNLSENDRKLIEGRISKQKIKKKTTTSNLKNYRKKIGWK
jgi:very-short-patch-repair endonuclease